MPTTYVLGAGASLHAGYPLASTMGEGVLDFVLCAVISYCLWINAPAICYYGTQ
jgi:hypothetical protein